MKYTDTEAYQKEVAKQFAKRNLKLEPGEVVDIFQKYRQPEAPVSRGMKT